MTETMDNVISNRTVRLQGWVIRNEKTTVTPVGLGLVATPDNVPPNFDALADVLALAKEIALESDLLMPLVVVVEGLDSEKGAQLRDWRRQQDYHRGKFLLLPARDRAGEDPEVLLHALLNPEAVDIRGFKPPAILRLGQFWEELVQDDRLEKAFRERLGGWTQVKNPAFSSPKKQQKEWQNAWTELLTGVPRKDNTADQDAATARRETPPPSTNSVCSRITAARITNFKGLKRCPMQGQQGGMLDLDADIILVTGANGNGKSSFVEALSLALTGFHPAWSGGAKDNFFFFGADSLEIQLVLQQDSLGPELERRQEKKLTKKLTIQVNKDEPTLSPENHLALLRKETGLEETGSGGREVFVPVSEQLHYRMTTYLPEHVNMLFDENVDPVADEDENQDPEMTQCLDAAEQILSIRHLFPSLAPEIEALCRAVESRQGTLWEDLDKLKTRIEDLENFSSLYERSREFLHRLQEHIRELTLEKARRWAPDSRWQEQPGSVKEFVGLLDDERQSLGQLFSVLPSWMQLARVIAIAQGKVGGGRGIEEIQRNIDALEQRKRELKSRIDEPETRSTSLVRLLECYQFLRENRDNLVKELIDWSDYESRDGGVKTPGTESLGVGDLARELEMVNTTSLRRAEDILNLLLGREQAKFNDDLEQVEGDLQREKEKLALAIKEDADAAAFDGLRDFLAWSEQQDLLLDMDEFCRKGMEYDGWVEERQHREREREDLQALAEFIRRKRRRESGDPEAGGDDSFRQALQDTFNRVLRRFVIADGMEEVEVTPQFQIKADVGLKEGEPRGVHCFSSGQRAQLAMAWMVACRELAQSEKARDFLHFPHRILIMDDPSTTFDTTNLLSQAILWRQLAYNPDPARRYQIFIVSHHEEFSSHLLDLLCPPPNHSMRLLRFTSWDPETGAHARIYDVEPSPVPEKERKAPEDGLKSAGRIFAGALENLREMVE